MHVCTLVVLISTAAAPPTHPPPPPPNTHPRAPGGPGSLKSALYERCWSPTAWSSWFRRQACLSFGAAKRSILPGRRHFHHPLPPSPISSTPKAELLRFVGSSNKWARACLVCVCHKCSFVRCCLRVSSYPWSALTSVSQPVRERDWKRLAAGLQRANGTFLNARVRRSISHFHVG